MRVLSWGCESTLAFPSAKVPFGGCVCFLIATVETLLAALKEGKQVDFGELGKFRLQITSKGAMTAEEFTANNITGVNIQFVPGEDLQSIFQNMEFNLVASRYAQAALLRAQKKGETTVDISKPGEEEGEV